MLVVGENSYVDVAYADSFFADYLDSDTWNNTTEEMKSKALITATSLIDNSYIWKGVKYDENQALQFPRIYTGCQDGTPEGEVPTAIKDATCIQAQYLLKNQNSLYTVDDNIKSASLDVMKIEYFESNYDELNVVDKMVSNMLSCYGKIKPSVNSDNRIFNVRTIR